MTADMQPDPQEMPQDATDQPLPPSEAPPGPEAPPEDPAAPEADTGLDVLAPVRQAILAGCTLAKAFATGDAQGINPDSYARAMAGVQAGAMALAALDPPERPVDPNAMQADHTRAAAAVLQDEQHSDDVQLQRDLAKQREGRPSGQTKPVTSKQ